MRIFITAFALLSIATLSSCSTSRVEQCKALTSEKTPKLSQNSGFEELLAADKVALEGYKKLWLSDQDLKQLRNKWLSLLERQISHSQKSVELEKESKASPGNPDHLRQAIEQSQKLRELVTESVGLIEESEKLCPSTEEQK